MQAVGELKFMSVLPIKETLMKKPGNDGYIETTENRFEKRLAEEVLKIIERMDSHFKWMLVFMMSQTGLILGFIYFLFNRVK